MTGKQGADRECSKCGRCLPVESFCKHSRFRCKECWNVYVRGWSAAHPGRASIATRRWEARHPERAAEYRRRYRPDPKRKRANNQAYRAKNLQALRAYDRMRLQTNPDRRRKMAACTEAWRLRNPEKLRAWRKTHAAECAAAHRRYRERNPEHVRALARDSYHRCKGNGKRRASSAAWSRRNRALAIGYTRAWQKKNPERVRHLVKAHAWRKRTASGKCPLEKWIARVEFYGWRCFYCLKPLTPRVLTTDHRIALARGGTNWPANLVPACRGCNSSKGIGAIPRVQQESEK